jgi:hypothetical protein
VTGELRACEALELLKQNRKQLAKRQVSKHRNLKGYSFDTAGPFQPTINKNVYIFCITDDYSRFLGIFWQSKEPNWQTCERFVIHLPLLRQEGQVSDVIQQEKTN